MIVVDLTREEMAKLWWTEELMGWYDRELLVWCHRLNHFSFKCIIRLSKRGVIPRNIINIRKLPLVSP